MTRITPRIGVIAVGRETFDVPFAEEMLEKVYEALDGFDLETRGERKIWFDSGAALKAARELNNESLDMILLLQITFTDAGLTLELVEALEAPICLWSFPEPRTGERLRLNSFCGINLAAHALSRRNLPYSWVHGGPSDPTAAEELTAHALAHAVRRKLHGVRLGVIGDHPDGFDACNYLSNELNQIFGVEAEQLNLLEFIQGVKALPDETAEPHYADRQKHFKNLAELEQAPLIKTLKVHEGLLRLARDRNFDGIAVRCWPEFFTEYGCAACGAIAMMNEKGIPGGCEADLYGVVTSLILQWISGEAAFNSDLVDVDRESDDCVFWHCGQAPIQMADPEGPIRGTIHSNRKLPLLSEFSLKPGRFTMARLSQGRGMLRMVIGAGEMLRRPLAFSGTSGTARLDNPIEEVMDRLMREGLEHHTAIVYGDHRLTLRNLADSLNLPIVELTD